ncbi:hypothetical protein PJL18_04023 [Paenarthrobacter nicotinovorans]|nr:hypothetical protein [Paenarthrobacter nicotinovorans]
MDSRVQDGVIRCSLSLSGFSVAFMRCTPHNRQEVRTEKLLGAFAVFQGLEDGGKGLCDDIIGVAGVVGLCARDVVGDLDVPLVESVKGVRNTLADEVQDLGIAVISGSQSWGRPTGPGH